VRRLYRPVGLRELELILEADARAFPPRLPEQPIFYPVLGFEYAERIARDWNAPDPGSGCAGFVTEFDVDADYLAQFEVKTVGAAHHQELWVPAEQLSEFNAHLSGRIQATHAFYGSDYEGPKPRPLGIRERKATEQLRALAQMHAYNAIDFMLEVTTGNWHLVYLNFGFWSANAPVALGLAPETVRGVLEAIVRAWKERRPELSLPVGHLLPARNPSR
jgi:hypothetical protein